MRRLTIAAAFLALLLVGQAYADDPIQVEIAAIDETPGQIIASIGVYDENGKPITDLTGANFKAALDKVSLPIVSARSGRANRVPASLLLLVDVSGSMQGKPINQARRASSISSTTRIAATASLFSPSIRKSRFCKTTRPAIRALPKR